MSNGTNFKLYDPVADVIAAVGAGGGGGTGGDGLPTTGGSLTGNLVMTNGSVIEQCTPPSSDCQVANKSYVDSTIENAINDLDPGPFLSLAGGTMIGAITQAIPPTTNLHLTNKGYVDAQLATIGTGPFLPLAGGTMTGALVQPLAPSNANDVVNKTYVDNSVSALGTGPFLSLAGGTMTGALVQPLAPSNANDVVNKNYVDNQISAITVDDATTSVKGIVQLAGDLGGAGTTATAPIISNLAITNAKMANMSGTSQLKGSSSSTANATDISLGPGLTMTGTSLDVNPSSVPSIPVTVGQGGTGATALTGYLIGNGTSAFTASATIPTTDLSGQFVGSVNGIAPTPTSGGNVAILPQNVTTGVLSALPAAGNNGYIYVVSGDPTPSNNGRTYIDDGTNWNEVTANLAATDARYTLKAGDTMTGDLIMTSGKKITLPDAPVGSTDAANKAYVDAQITAANAPDATTSVKGIVQLAGDLGGAGTTATAPVISDFAVSNNKLANLSGPSQLKGSSSTSSAATDITLGSGLGMTNNVLSVNTTTLANDFLPLAGGTMSGQIVQPLIPVDVNDLTNKAYVDAQVASLVIDDATTSAKGIVQLGGDLGGAGTTAAAPLISNLAITNAKMANMSGTSQLKGSSSISTAVTNISLGSGLTMNGTSLDVNPISVPSLPVPVDQGGTGVTTLASGYLVSSGGTSSLSTNPTIPTTDLSGQFVGTVNGIAPVPSNGGNVTVLINNVSTGTLSNLPTQVPSNGQIYVVSGDPTSSNNGRTYISDGQVWREVTANLASTDARYTLKSGDTMSGDLIMSGGAKVTLPNAPVGSTDAANKAYVDAQITSASPDATTSVKGKVQLAGDLGGAGTTADAPIISDLAITNSKLANMSGTSQLKGSSNTSNTATDITLGTGLSMNGNQLNVNTTTLSNDFLPLAGGTMGGAIVQPIAPINDNDVTNKAYVDAQITSNSVDDATTSATGIVQLAGDLGGAGTTATAPVISNLAITNVKMADMGGTSQLKGSSSTETAVTNISLGPGLTMTGTSLDVNPSSVPSIPVPVGQGGTGATALTGYLIGNGTSAVTASATIPTTDLSGQFVGSVNGVAPVPTSGGNVSVFLQNVSTGVLSALPAAGNNGYIYVVSGDPTPSNNGRTYIDDGTNWNEVTTNLAATDARYTLKAGDTMTGDLIMTSGKRITLPDAPVGSTDAANKAYVDAQITSATIPDATTSVKGKVQLAGDLGGTGTIADAPIISNFAITNAKMANLSGPSQLKGSSSTSNAATDITLGSGLGMTNNVLSVNTVTLANDFLPLAGGTMSGQIVQPLIPVDVNDLTNKAYVDAQVASLVIDDATTSAKGIVQLGGDLGGAGTTATTPIISNLAITNAKMANMSGTSQLKGSSSTETAVTNISLGSGLTMTGTSLDVNPSSVPSIPVLVSQGGTGATALTGYLIGNGTSAVTASATIPTTDLSGQFVGTVNGVAPVPTSGGNVTTFIQNVSTGVLLALPAQPQPNGQIYVVSGDPTPSNNGRTYISDGQVWREVTANLASTDARYTLKAGDTMTGDLTMISGKKITLPDAPVGSTDAANKAYVDAQITSASIPDATTSVKGKIQLAGDLGGAGTTAAAPIITNLAITNSKLANMSGTSQLKGSSNVSNTTTDITLGTGLSMNGNQLDIDSVTLANDFLPLAGGTMSGAIVQPIAPINNNDVVNKAYVDAQISTITVDDATTSTKGIIQLAGDLGGAGTTAAAPIITDLAITNAKMADMGGTSQLKGSSSSTAAVTNITLGSGLTMTGTSLDVNPNSVPSIPVTVGQGGTGATTLTGYLIGNGTSAVTTSATIPTTDLSGQFVGTVNGVAPVPTSGGNVSVFLQNVSTGVLSALPAAGNNGDIYVVSGDPTPSNNGRTYIDDGTNWNEVTANLATTDARYTLKAGDTMTGDLIMSGGTKITLPNAPVAATDATNKAYVDAQIGSVSIADATTSVKGIVQLAGDLGGAGTTATAPVISNLAITNAKLANMSGTSQLKGSSNASNTATDITLGSGLSMVGSTLNVDPSNIQKAGAAQFGVVEFAAAGDLNATAANSGIGVIKPLAVTNAKMANMSGTGQLKGSGSTNASTTDITLGSGLTMTGTTLAIDSTVLQKAGNTQFGTVEFDSTGDLTETFTNSGIALVKDGAITPAKLAPLSQSSKILGSSQSSTQVSEITIGPGLNFSGTTLTGFTSGLGKLVKIAPSFFDDIYENPISITEPGTGPEIVEYNGIRFCSSLRGGLYIQWPTARVYIQGNWNRDIATDSTYGSGRTFDFTSIPSFNNVYQRIQAKDLQPYLKKTPGGTVDLMIFDAISLRQINAFVIRPADSRDLTWVIWEI